MFVDFIKLRLLNLFVDFSFKVILSDAERSHFLQIDFPIKINKNTLYYLIIDTIYA